MAQVQVNRVITQSVCSEEAEESTKKVLSRKSIQHHLLLGLIFISVFFAHIASVWASSAGNPREEEVQPELSLWDEVRNMQVLHKNESAGIKVNEYIRGLLTKSNPELKGVNEYRYFLYIYRKKEYVDLDIAKYSMGDIQYKVDMPKGVHSLRILDSNTEQDELARRQRNRVFVKLLYSFYRLQFTSLVIEGIRIGPEEKEMLMLQGIRNSALKADRLLFRNVTTETIRVFFKRLNKVSVGRLCIEICGILKLDNVIALRSEYEIGGLELNEVKTAPDSHQVFLGRVSHIEHLKIYRVQFISVQVLRSLLFMLKGTLEIDLGMYKQVLKAVWAIYANRVRQLHLIDIGNLASIEEELWDTFPAFLSLTTLTLSVRHPQLLDPSMLSSVIEYVKKYYGGVKNVVLLGKMDIKGVKKVIRNKESGIAQSLQEHADTHFTFIDSTGIDPSRKYLLFIPLSVYNETTTVKELGSRLGVLGEMSNWDWNKQKGPQVRCETCNTEQEGYVTQLVTGGIICEHYMRYNIKEQRIFTAADKNVCLINTQYLWYLKRVIFLSQELEGKVYLAEIRDIFKMARKYGKELMLAVKPNNNGTKRLAVSTEPIQDSIVGTSIASTSATWQPQQPESRPGTSRYMGEHTAEYTYYPPAQPPAAKQPRYESAASDWNTFEQPVVPGGAREVDQSEFMGMPEQPTMSWNEEPQMYMNTEMTDNLNLSEYIPQHWLDDLAEEALIPEPVVQEIGLPEYMEMPGQIEMQLDEELQMHRDAEMVLNQNESKPRDWLDVMLEEVLRPKPEAQQTEQAQTMSIFGDLPELTDEDLERYLRVDTA